MIVAMGVILFVIVFALASKTDTNPLAMLAAIPALGIGLGIFVFTIYHTVALAYSWLVSLVS